MQTTQLTLGTDNGPIGPKVPQKPSPSLYEGLNPPYQSEFKLLNEIDKRALLRNIEKYISYCKIHENIANKTYLSTISYTDNLDEPLKQISQNIELKAEDYLDICYTVVDLLRASFNRLIIGKANCILIHNGPINILKLTNDTNPEFNTAITVDINKIQQYLIEETNRVNSIHFRHNIIDYTFKFIWNVGLVYFIGNIIYNKLL
jgi:hypothetical protein